MWHLRDLAYFVAVADHGNFTRAAEELFVSQPTLSKQVAALERSVKTPLLRREHDGVRLTRAGEALLPFARRLLSTAAEAEGALSAALAELTIGFWLSPGNGLLPAALARFAKLHPEASVALRRADWSEIWAGVESRRADMGLLWWTAGSKAPGMGQTLLATEPMMLAMSPDHPLAGRDEIWPDDLRSEVILDSPGDWRRPLALAPFTVTLGRAVRTVRTIDETIECVASGLGVSPVPRSLVTAHMPPPVIAKPLRGVPSAELVAVWRLADEDLARVRSLIECVVRAARTALAEPGSGASGRPSSLI
jgi:DNA-binding transcriptional LysR family regulator